MTTPDGLPDAPALIDHHCHGVITTDLDRATFESLMNEAAGPSPLGTTLFDSMLGIAIRRECAPVLDLAPFAAPAAYIERRWKLGHDEVNRRFLIASGVSDYLVDGGVAPELVTSAQDTAAYSNGNGHEVVRLETLAEAIIDDGVRGSEVADRVRERLAAHDAVGAKSIAAYRNGLALPAEQPSIDAFVTAVDETPAGAGGWTRITHPTVSAWLAHEAIAAGMPLQFHSGYGDNDLDLARCDPLLLTDFLRATEERHVPVMLLHNYPFHRHASYLAQVFGHVFTDVGLATHNTGALSDAVIRESLELVPFSKMLYSSDAFGLAEFYYLGSLLFRRGLARVLGVLLDAGEIDTETAERITDLIARDNARRAYGLP